MMSIVLWWVIVQIFGWAVLPLAHRLFRHLPDRGYILAKPLGLLLVSYLFWLLCALGLLRNTTGSIIFCLVVVAGVSAYLYQRASQSDGYALGSFLRNRWRLILVSELLLLAGFVLWALYRAYNPDIAATEKPMEFAFLNGILRSDRFPPLDPWLSGYAISYYYFGYVMMAVLARLSGVAPSIAFNLGIALLFALTLTGAFSLVYNLVAGFVAPRLAQGATDQGRPREGVALGFGLFGAWAVAIAGNLEGFFEAIHSKGLGLPEFWSWLDIKTLSEVPMTGHWIPTDNWWWWRASRVIHDRDFLGNSVEVIDEFPFFSFLLGDMHPHVLALPFVLLVLGLALNLILTARSASEEAKPGWLKTIFGEDIWVFVLYALCVGALGFLNTWDLPIYFVIVLGAFALQRRTAQVRNWLTNTLYVAVILGLLCIVLYAPFYLGFQSQAGGFLPTLLFATRWHQYLIMFGLPLFMLIGLLVTRWAEEWRSRESRLAQLQLLRSTVYLWAGLFLAAFAIMLGALVPLFLTGSGRAFLDSIRSNEAVQQVIGDRGWGELLPQLIARRLADPGAALFVALLLAVAIIPLWRSVKRACRDDSVLDDGSTPLQVEVQPFDRTTTFALWLALIGLALTFSVEFIYLRDTFGTRMNTVFKFYYQGWLLLSLSGVYGVFYVLKGSLLKQPEKRGVGGWRIAWSVGLVLLVALTSVYPLLAAYNKADGFQIPPTLDGTAYMARFSPDDYTAIQWLNEHVRGAPTIIEATGGSYSQYGRVSGQTGLPTVLGWGGHELQWRGNYDEAGKREPDIDKIYGDFDPKLTLTLLDKYGIRYVYVGALERQKYPENALSKFDQLLDVAYQSGQVTIYERKR